MGDQAPGGPRRAVPLDRVRAARGEARIAVPRNKVAGTRAFRRLRTDRAFGVIGVLLIVFALVLVFQWERRIPPEPSYGVDWIETQVNVTLPAGAPASDGCFPGTPTARGQRCNITVEQGARGRLQVQFDIPEANVSSVSLQFYWKDDVGDEPSEYDELWFNLTGPETTEAEIRLGPHWASGWRWLNASQMVVPVPTVRSVPVATEAEARAAIGDTYRRMNGTGPWSLTIDVPEARDDWHAAEAIRRQQNNQCPQDQDSLCRADTWEEVWVRISYKYYQPAFRPAVR